MIAGRPMLQHLLATCEKVFSRIVVVVGVDMQAVSDAALPHGSVIQHEGLGPAHAALQAEALFGDGDVAVLFADTPLIRPDTLRRLLDCFSVKDVGLSLLAVRPADPQRHGRVVERDGFVDRIEAPEQATAPEPRDNLCYAGVLCAGAARMRGWLSRARDRSTRRELFLGEVVALARAEGLRVAAVEAPEADLRPVNSRADLAVAEASVQDRLRTAAMEAGVTMTAPATVFLCTDTHLEADVIIEPHVVFGPGVTVERDVEIRAFSHLEGCTVRRGATIGPFARLRSGTDVGAGARVGNFVEIKATTMGEGAAANHLAFLGDCSIGAGSNVGAGTITCNYDGFTKHHTTIGDNVFLGSDSILVAPVTIGDRAMVTAGSVITEDVMPDAMAFGRARQEQKAGRAAAFRISRKKESR
jgi:bifunctional UDP-N-acetylglucosamine pyrophosphorylase/glucosamine-1-phosphate N-acetyltransferase